jgi:hypothetical protein
MTTTKQTFPPVTIEALPNGLLRLEDETVQDYIAVIDLHPVQVQTLAAMVGFAMPDRTHKALGRLASRLTTIKAQVSDLESRLHFAVNEQDIDVCPELACAEFIGAGLGELLKDIEDLSASGIEPMPDAVANPGGQLTLPV